MRLSQVVQCKHCYFNILGSVRPSFPIGCMLLQHVMLLPSFQEVSKTIHFGLVLLGFNASATARVISRW